MCKPVIKWVGGKRQLLNDIKINMPVQFNQYFEPFIGGGALFFDLKKQDSFINDYNPELSNLYRVIKETPLELIKSLNQHINDEKYYYSLRELDRKPSYRTLDNIEKASRFIFLNKTGFNGLYRVNKKGQNNVPFGRYKNPKIVDAENILACSAALKNTTILNGDFEIIKDRIKKGDFVYLDPPYVPVSPTSNFVGYTDQGFDYLMQERLKLFCDYIHSVGAYFMLSNSNTDFISDLYNTYNIKIVEAGRSLNCKGDCRGKVEEVLIKNY